MIINELTRNPLLKAIKAIMNDTSHSYECDVIVDDGVLYAISHEYNIIIIRDEHGIYKIRVFDYANMTEHVHYACSVMEIARIIRNIHVFAEVYRYSYMYEYLLGDNYNVSPILIGCDCIHICIVDTNKYDTIASIVFTRHSDGAITYRYGGGYGEYRMKSYSKTLYDFLEGWA